MSEQILVQDVCAAHEAVQDTAIDLETAFP
jgi:hypothetical protein